VKLSLQITRSAVSAFPSWPLRRFPHWPPLGRRSLQRALACSKKEERSRCEDYRRFGAENIWIVSPQGPKLWIATAKAHIEGGARVSVAGHAAAYLALSELELD
jgi:hypothetical protein